MLRPNISRPDALSRVGEKFHIHGFEFLATAQIVDVSSYCPLCGAVYDCVVFYTDTKKKPDRSDYHESSLTEIDP